MAFTDRALRAALGIASPAGTRGRLSTLIFHRVLERPDPLFPEEVDAERFDRICAWIASWFNTLPLDDAVRRMSRGALPERALAITFDDGYADNHDVAMPILKRHGLCATFFVATGYLDGGRMWNDSVIEALRRTPHARLDLGLVDPSLGEVALDGDAQRRATIDAVIRAIKYLPEEQRAARVDRLVERCACTLPDTLMMSEQQVRSLHRSGMQIGPHTVSHPILARLPDDRAREEIFASRQALRDIVGAPMPLFAYPNGKPFEDYGPRDVELVRQAGFEAAVSTAWGAARGGSPLWELPRFTPWDRVPLRFGARLLAQLVRGRSPVSVGAAG